jgi:hypothetical protein
LVKVISISLALAIGLSAMVAAPVYAAPISVPTVAAETSVELAAVKKKKRVVVVRKRVIVKKVVVPAQPVRQCQPRVAVVGTQYPIQSAARNSARNAWMKQVRFSYGEIFANPANAVNAGPTCTRSTSGLIKFWRCEFSGVPCKP